MLSLNMSLFLLVALFTKHYFSDFKLQTFFMLGKGKPGLAFIAPLASHCAVHMIFTIVILVIVKPEYSWLAAIEFVAHFVIDRAKATYKLPSGVWEGSERGNNLNKYYSAFGLDQYAHGLCYILIWYILNVAK
jgi:hypothetical protein